ncbi:MAG: type 4a pilus biogenesis protein PilO [Armatimonadota bacterium]|nr:type 4a pilus biogenesis protein PilO [Armatimonadota bacterium]MDR5697251.1 type 4a pilus biogenesis protein PilO [Armatimonadota bacterium]
MTLRPREWFLVFAVIVIAMVAGFYFFFYQPQQAEARRLEAELERVASERQRLEALVAEGPEVEREFNETRARVAELETKLPSAREIPTLLVQLEQTVRESQATITLIRPGPLQTGTAPAGQRQQPEQIQYQTFSVELGAEGNYAALVDFLERLQDFPRLLVLSDVRVTPTAAQGVPAGQLLALTVRATTYVLPEAVSR